MRSAVGGWVEKRRTTPSPRNGFAIIRWLTEASRPSSGSGSRRVPVSILRRADGQGERVAAELRAGGVRLELPGTADRQLDDHGRDRAEDEQQQRAEDAAPSSSSEPPNGMNHARWPIQVTTAASAPATEEIRMSRL